MGSNLESSSTSEVSETPAIETDNTQSAETDATSENFEDCSVNEVSDSDEPKACTDASEDDEDYSDCSAQMETQEEVPEIQENDEDDFSDCSVSENTENTTVADHIEEAHFDEELSDEDEELTEEDEAPLETKEVTEEDEVPPETEEVAEEDEVPSETKEVTEEDKESLESEELAAEDEVPPETDEVIEEDAVPPETEEIANENEIPPETEEIAEEEKIPPEMEETDSEDEVPSEAEEVTEEDGVLPETEEVASEDEVSPQTEEATEENEVLPATDEAAEEEASDQTSENLTEENAESTADETDNSAEDAGENKKEEKENLEEAEKTTDEIEVEQAEMATQQERLSLQERIDKAFENEEVSADEINKLKKEHATELEAKVEERDAIEAQRKSKFDDVLSKEKGGEEYKQALQEYNALQDQKVVLDEQVAEMEEQQDILEKKSLALRDAQIQKGAEAMAVSAVTLAGVDELQERYDQAYYDVKSDKSELASIREDSCSAIKELSAEKDSIKQAMDAKMDEISEYVTSNNMDRYDTAHDLRYQQMSAEYNAMKESYDRIGYSIVKLDENNKAITERLGDEYVSMVELPPSSRISEVNDGTDVPGETNYFIDEAKASEVLSHFKQGNWEQLSIQEQKQAVEKLADYNAEILGVEDKPRIIYYNAEDPCDFGGYSAKQNAIYINEYNMHDAAETADTISHEYRHKYQHERAEKLETERDLEFKDGFDNYIRAEDDYQGYKEQLVEADARVYAQIVKDKISSYSETSSENINLNGDQGSHGAEYAKLNPEKGAVFEKVSVDELPDDFEQKDRIKYKEVLEAKELDELRDVASVHYENGKQLGDKVPEFNTYKEHHDIESGHIEKVRVKSLEAADALEAHFSQNDYDGLYSPNIDRRTVEVMSIYHDTGMDGNIKAEDYETERAVFISDEAIREKFVANALSKKEKEAIETGKPFDRVAEEQKANEKFEREGFENHFRPNHSLESAIHALRDRESISKLGVNADEVALGCLVHSKSNSGLRNIASEDDWRVAVGRLQNRVDEFNQSHPDEQIHFDSSFLLNKDGSFNQEKLAEMRSEAIVLRIGDANGHDTNSRTSQNGKAIEFALEEKTVTDELPSDFESKFENGDYEAYFLEVQSADVKVDGVELNNANDPKGISRMFAVGEGNFQSLNCEVEDNGTIKQNFELCDGNAFPLSTQHCIEERLGEYKTAQPMNYTPVVKLGSSCSDEVYNSYLAFADRIERDYNVRMEVVR